MTAARQYGALTQVYHEGGLFTDIDRLHDVRLDALIEPNSTKMLLPLSDRGEQGISDFAQAATL